MEIILSWKIFNYMLEIDILRNDSQKYLGVLSSDFKGLDVQKMPCWLRLCELEVSIPSPV